MKVYALNNPKSFNTDTRFDVVKPPSSVSKQTSPVKHQEKQEDIIDNAILATYIESLKMFAKESKGIDRTLAIAIDNLPSPDTVKTQMGYEEAKILQESINWAWEKITGKKMTDELKTTHAQENMLGNYWILKNGIVLEGVNHLTIIKNNLSLMAILLDLDQMAILGNMSDPNKCIQMAIANGAIRVFINSDKEAFFQISSATYGSWGRDKIKKLDFTHKTIKVVDLNKPYYGWETGVVVKI